MQILSLRFRRNGHHETTKTQNNDQISLISDPHLQGPAISCREKLLYEILIQDMSHRYEKTGFLPMRKQRR